MNNVKFIEKIRKKTGNTIYKYNLLNENDNVLVALSGGKDSLVMLDILVQCKKHIPFNYNIFACHVIARGVDYSIDKEYLENFCSSLSVPLFFEEINVEIKDDKIKHACFICSWHRRKKLFEISRKLQCNKLAFGHHMNDALETFFLNLIYHGSISSLPEKIDFFDGDIKVIRPLLYLNEDEIIEYINIREYKKELKRCKHDNESRRFEVKNLINDMVKMNPTAKINIMRAMDNIYYDYLPKKVK